MDRVNALLDGVLPAVLSGGNALRSRLKSALSNPREFLGQRRQDLQTMQDQDSALSYSRGLLSPQDPAHAKMARNDPAFNQQQAKEAEQRWLDIAMQGLTVWHGSPHKFAPTAKNPLGEFDSSKIGTGEGAQSYGHGLYLAENPKVAKEGYADRLALDKDPRGSLNDFVKYLSENLSDANKSKSIVRQYLENDPKWNVFSKDEDFVQNVLVAVRGRSPNGTVSPASLKAYDALDKVLPKVEPNLYKVDLPDSAIAKMLDWDRPLSKQPNAVNALKKARLIGDDGEAQGLEMFRGPLNRLTPEQLVDDLATQWGGGYGADDLLAIEAANGRAAASQYLRSLGFPGIRYLDGGSRVKDPGTARIYDLIDKHGGNVEKAIDDWMRYIHESPAAKAKTRAALIKDYTENPRTRNFVVFPGEEQMLNILERNGSPPSR